MRDEGSCTCEEARFTPPDDVLVSALTNSTNGVILVLDRDGIVRSPETESWRAGPDDYDWQVGQAYTEPMPAHMAAERSRVAAEAIERYEPRRLIGMMRGRLVATSFVPFGPKNDPCLVVCTASCTVDWVEGAADVIAERFATTHDLGEFSRLSGRELEVLSLLGRGMSNEQIAQQLHRSIRTVHGHRLALGTKLASDSRVELARVAINSGLARLPLEYVNRVWQGSRSETGGRR